MIKSRVGHDVRWDKHFLDLALVNSKMSKDPSTQVGAIIVGRDRELISGGFNGFPRGIEDTPERLNDREAKLKLVVHAEMNAIMAAAKLGISLKGAKLYLCATDNTGEIWGSCPCYRCVVHVIQAGITHITSYPFKNVPSRWKEDLEYSKIIIKEAGIIYHEISTYGD